MVGWIDGVGCCFGFAGAGVVGAAVVGVAVGVDAGAGVSVGAVVAGAAVVGGISRQQSSNTAGQQHDGMVKQKHSNKARKHHSETATQQDSMNPINQQTNFPGKQHTNQLMRPGGMREAIKPDLAGERKAPCDLILQRCYMPLSEETDLTMPPSAVICCSPVCCYCLL